MSDPTYLLAKYVPDPKRMEPRNIGVILWSRGGIEHRFLPSEEAAFVDDQKMFDRWIAFWAKTCREGAIETKTGKTVTPRSREFLDALVETQRGNYLLYHGGFLLDDVRASERTAAVNFLYRELVEVVGGEEPEQKDSLASRCDAMFGELGLAEREEFIADYPLELEAEGVRAPFRFDYAWENDHLDALFLRVNLGVQPSTTNAAFLFEHAKNSPKAQKAERYALVAGEAKQVSAAAEERLAARRKMLGQLSHVVEVNDINAVKAAVGKLLV